MTRRAFLVGYYGVGNLGDEAIREAIEAGAEQRGWLVDRYAVRRPTEDPRAVRLRASPIAYLRAIARADRVVLGGGGILKDEGLGLPIELLLTALAARVLGRPVAVLAAGVGPFYGPLGRAIVGATARLAQTRTVRDGASVRALEGLGIPSTLVADPVFSMEVDGAAAAITPPTTRRLVVCVRPWFEHGHRDPAAMRRLRDAMAAALSEAVAAEWTVTLLPLYPDRDLPLAADLAAAVPGATLGTPPLAWSDLARCVRDAEAVVAMRYHALAAAIVVGRPAVAIAYEPKVSALANRADVPWVDPTDADQVAGLPATLAALLRGAAPRGSAVAPAAPGPADAEGTRHPFQATLGSLRREARDGLDAAFPAIP